ncbi:MAG: hypothetical protein Q27BPR15_00040 [Rhodobacter sp. CACIA14H1]|nr:MAG: hypothetical protein Q27BPR15_00040 [Rhodobacter sp. CACIA14H1]
MGGTVDEEAAAIVRGGMALIQEEAREAAEGQKHRYACQS